MLKGIVFVCKIVIFKNIDFSIHYTWLYRLRWNDPSGVRFQLPPLSSLSICHHVRSSRSPVHTLGGQTYNERDDILILDKKSLCSGYLDI